jgi:hypothetical protein
MSKSTFPTFFDQGGSILHVFKIDGSAVDTSFSSAGLDGRGKMLGSIKDAANVQTFLFKQSMVDAYIFLQPLTDNGSALVTPTLSGDHVTGFTLTGTERDDNTTPLADQDFYVYVIEFTTTQFVT